MHWRGHVGLSLLATAPLVGHLLARDRIGLAAAVVSVATLLATLPDADEFLPIRHRGPTHTVWFAVGLTVAIGVVAAVLVPALDAVVVGVAAGLSLASHLLGDVVTPMGLRPFAPLSDWHVSLNVTPSKARTVNRLLFAAGLLAVATSIVLF